VQLEQWILLAVQISIALTVFGFGLQATPGDVSSILRHRALLGRSLVAMFVVMPIVAVVLVQTFDLLPAVRIGLLALAISPVPPLLPRRQMKAGGDTAYALGLMVLVTLLAIVVVPLGARLLGSLFGQPFAMPSASITRVVLVLAIAPLVAGLALRTYLPKAADRISRPTELVSQVLLTGGILPVLFVALPTVFSLVGNGTLLAMIAFVAAGLVAGDWLGGPDTDKRIVLALSTATRHPAIALAIARVNSPNESDLGAAILLYLLVNVFVTLPYSTWRGRRRSASEHG
jgi:BASS family bile acid:Na+ symporter